MSAGPPLPIHTKSPQEERSEVSSSKHDSIYESSTAGVSGKCVRPHPKPSFPSPRLRFECRDLNHPGANTFFSNKQPASDLSFAVATVLKILYTPTETNTHIPPTRSVTLILRPMSGVAYTTGSELDNDHKEMHFSLDYIHGITARTPGREAQEIQGVLAHEMVHAWQWSGFGTAPGGLIEGIADFVRLKAQLNPPHWKRKAAEKWDQGYEHTAYFLEWVEEECGEGSVRRINDRLRDHKYVEVVFWKKLFAKTVEDLWEGYKSYLGRQKRKEREEKHKMGEDAFWAWVKEKQGGEDMIVLKAMWRTRRYTRNDQEKVKDKFDIDLERLWSLYMDSIDAEKGLSTEPEPEQK
ncbi:MAG: hypothetical protein Q9163_005666 [Psora crenata]